MHRLRPSGYTLLELMVVLTVLGALATVALPHYDAYRRKARAAQCLANRYHIDMAERNYFMDHDTPGLVIDKQYPCPSGGSYVWLLSDPRDPGYPRVGCSVHFAALPPEPPPGEGIIFASQFDDMSALTPLLGKWRVQNGALAPEGAGERRLAFGEENWTDYRITTLATLDKGSGYGVYYRADGEKDISGYCFQYDLGYGSGEFIVRRVRDGREESPIQRIAIPKGFPVYDQPHEIKISVTGDRHIISLDGQVVLDFQDDAFSGGMAGFRAWSDTQVSFDSVVVSRVE